MLKRIFIFILIISHTAFAENEELPVRRTSELIKEACRNIKYQCNKSDIVLLDRQVQSCEILMGTEVCREVKANQDYKNRLRKCDMSSICEDAMIFEADLWGACFNSFVDGQSEKITKYKLWLKDKISQSNSKQQLLSDVNLKIGDKYNQVQCLDRKSRIEMYCWGSAYLSDPAILTYGVTQKAWGALQSLKLFSK